MMLLHVSETSLKESIGSFFFYKIKNIVQYVTQVEENNGLHKNCTLFKYLYFD